MPSIHIALLAVQVHTRNFFYFFQARFKSVPKCSKSQNQKVSMSAYVVILKNQKMISVRAGWVQNPKINEKSVVFHSPNDGEQPNFTLKPLYFFNDNVAACYQSRVLKKFGNYVFMCSYNIIQMQIQIVFFSCEHFLPRSTKILICFNWFYCDRFC